MKEKIFEGAACSITYTITSLLYFAVFFSRESGNDLSTGVQVLLSFIFPCAFSLGVDQVKR